MCQIISHFILASDDYDMYECRFPSRFVVILNFFLEKGHGQFTNLMIRNEFATSTTTLTTVSFWIIHFCTKPTFITRFHFTIFANIFRVIFAIFPFLLAVVPISNVITSSGILSCFHHTVWLLQTFVVIVLSTNFMCDGHSSYCMQS